MITVHERVDQQKESPGPACRESTTMAFVEPGCPSSSGDQDAPSVTSRSANSRRAARMSTSSSRRSAV
jgi:hypothetical protein